MTDAQQRRLIGSILTLVIGGITVSMALVAAPKVAYQSMAVPGIIGALLVAGGVYLLLRFVSVLRSERRARTSSQDTPST